MDNIVQINEQFKTLGANLCAIRNEIKMSQGEVAEWINVDRRVISAIESGKSKNIEAICEYCEKFSIKILITFKE